MEEPEEKPVQNLDLQACIGFNGTLVKGLHLHPNGNHIIYATGNKIIIRNINTDNHEFLSGHTNTISTLAVSRSGIYIASGQINHPGFMAMIILWDFAKGAILSKYESHKERVEAIAFSPKDEYLFSLGGRDCGAIVVWDIKNKKVLSSTVATRSAQGDAVVIYPMNYRDPCFITAGDNTLMLWNINKNIRTINGLSITLARLKRKVLCVEVDELDDICYCGTSTGDVLKIKLNFHSDLNVLEPQSMPKLIGCFTKISKKRLPEGMVELYQMGVRAILLTSKAELVIGSGDGTIDLVIENTKHLKKLKKARNIAFKLCSLPEFKVLRSTQVPSAITSLVNINEDTFYVGTEYCEIFQIDYKTFNKKLIITCHTNTIYDIVFPSNFSDVFATASQNNIRIWSTKSYKELLRIMVPNFTCSKLMFTYDGKSILSAWNDGVIRAFTPLTGRLIYAIMNAHNKGVSTLCVTRNGKHIISGGCEGQVRVWDIQTTNKSLICTLKEHKGPVCAIHINKADDEAVSASTDGSCIIWDIVNFVRKQVIFSNTLFMTVCYHTTDVQILTSGSDKKICYWEVLDGSLVRSLEGSISGGINAIGLSQNGLLFGSGGNDQIVRVWDYQGGNICFIGLGHCSVITAVAFSPNGKFLISTGAAGEIFIWEAPSDAQKPNQFTVNDFKLLHKGRLSNEEHISKLSRNNSSKSSKESNCK